MNVLKYKDFHDYGLPHNKADSPTKIMENINYLYNKMKQCTRNVTYFDLYKINTIITQDSEFEAQVNALEPYTTAIINANITTATDIYSPGDMIVKNIDGTTSTIFAQRGGIFYPKMVTKTDDLNTNNFTYDFSFAFQSAAPTADTSSEAMKDEETSTSTWTADYAAEIIFKELKSGTPASPYNQVFTKPTSSNWTTSEEEHIDINTTTMVFGVVAAHLEKTNNNTTTHIPIEPIAHCYSTNEEIYMDQEISYSKTKDATEDSPQEGEYIIKYPLTALCTKVVIK